MNTCVVPERWFAYVRPRAQAAVRLFCFPHAGGGAALFRSWQDGLPAALEVWPVQLPGRETRFREPVLTRWEPLLAALEEALDPPLDRPFALFGHSLGALVAFELARRLRRHGLEPVHVFASGCGAPHLRVTERPIHDLPERDFREALRQLHGTPSAILDNAEVMELLLPALRADFALCETYRYVEEPPLNCAITVLGGQEDDTVSPGELDAWRRHTCGTFRLALVAGNHFFVQPARPLVLRLLAQELLRRGVPAQAVRPRSLPPLVREAWPSLGAKP